MGENHELELLQIQYDYHTGMFACDSQMLFSDVELTSFPGITTVKVDSPHVAKRKSTGAWINAPFYANAWEAIAKDGSWADYDWTVKVDPDTVFLPDRLKLKLSGQEIGQYRHRSGNALQECEGGKRKYQSLPLPR